MNENYTQMNERHKKERMELENSCPHDESSWMDYQYAPGHYGGRVKVCKYCNKILEQTA